MAAKAIKEKQYKQLIKYLEEDRNIRLTTKNKYFKIFTFLYYTGCRINEVCKLKTEDINTILETKKVRVRTDKTKRFKGSEFRTVCFSDDGIAAIKKYFSDILKHPDSFVIRAWNNKDKQANITGLTNYINSYIQKALNDTEYSTHSFRRGLISEMIIDKKIPGEVTQKFIGHRNYATTQKYVDVTDEDVQNNLVR